MYVILFTVIALAVAMPQDIYFPDDTDLVPRYQQEEQGITCNFEKYEVYWNASGTCEKLLESNICGAQKWLVWDDTNESPACQTRQCPIDKVLFNGICKPETGITCPTGTHVVLDITGEAVCDCIPGYVYWRATDSCYGVYQQGPCRSDQYFRVNAAVEPVCLRNPCTAGKVPVSGTCQTLGEQGNCENGVLAVDPANFQIVCNEEWVDQFQLINMPESPCPRGSRRDAQGACRKIFRNRNRG